MKAKCTKCEKEFKWTGSAYCPSCRRALAKPIDTVCAGCGKPAHGLFCEKCAQPLVETGKRLIAQERYNRLEWARQRTERNPAYSSGDFPGDRLA